MERFYKNHHVELSAWLDHDGWFIRVFIHLHYKEDVNRLVSFPLNDTFATYGEAVVAGFAAAEKWIDKNEPSR